MVERWGWFRVMLVVLGVWATVFSCEPPVDPPSGKGLSLSKTDIKVGSGDTEASLTVVARLDWTLTVTSGADWLGTPSVSSGVEGSTTVVNFTFSENPGDTNRTARLTLVAEGEETTPYECVITQTYRGVRTEINEWIYNQMMGWYYWDTAVKSAAQPEAELPYNEFLLALVKNAYAKGAYDNTEDPPTIDGYTVKNAYGESQRVYYSNISRTPAQTRSPRGASESVATTFGFDFEMVTMLDRDDSPTGHYQLLVTSVRDNSPAALANMKRGEWIIKYENQWIDDFLLEVFWNRAKLLDGGTRMSFTVDDDGRVSTTEDARNVSINAVEMTATPILRHNVLTSEGGKKVAYLLYNGFERGDNIGSDRNPRYEFAEELKEVFKGFRAAGVTDLVLDLRYNPGGYVDQCRLLTSLAADVNDRQVFTKMQRNKNINQVYPRVQNPEVLNFYDGDTVPDRLNLRKIYVLTTSRSASASELVINSLHGVDIEVVQIGATTNGKNVGMDLLETSIDGWDYKMWPITFKTLNAKNFSDYAGGYKPQYLIGELRDALQGNGQLYELGDSNERLLKAALTLIDGGRVTSDSDTTVTRADGVSMQLLPRPHDPRVGGMKYIPDQAQIETQPQPQTSQR